MLAAASFDRVRQVRQLIEIVKASSVRDVGWLYNASALVF